MAGIDEPRDLLLGDDNDLVITDDLQFASGLRAVAQECRIRLQMFRGEWFLDLEAGIPWFDEILGKRADLAIDAAKRIFQSELEAVEDVQSVLRLDVSYDGVSRTLAITWRVRCVFGDTPLDIIKLRVGGVNIA